MQHSPSNHSVRSTSVTLATILLAATLCWAAKQFAMPEAKAAQTYPAHDVHSDEGLTVALDPYDKSDKTRIFSVHYDEIGMLPILLVITNDSDRTVSLIDMKAQLVTRNRSKLSPAQADDILRKISHPRTGSNYPVPFPTKKIKGGVSPQTRDEIENSQFMAKAIEPHSTQIGFLFFDVGGIDAPLEGAHFYLTGVRNAQGNELMYFEVPLEKYTGGATQP